MRSLVRRYSVERLFLHLSTWRVQWVGVGWVVRSGGPLWCWLGAGVGQWNRWMWQR